MTWQLSFKQAAALHQAGDLAQAERLYREVLATEPRNFPAHYQLAFLLYQRQSGPAALESIDAALALQPDAAEALVLRSILLLGDGRLEEALVSVSRAAARDPGNVQAWHNRGVILASLRRFEEAVHSFDRALSLNPVLVAALYKRAEALTELNRHAEAVVAFDAVLARAPDLFDAWSNRGSALFELGRYDEALENYDRATRLRPDVALAWTNRGKALIRLQRFDDALASYDKAIALAPASAEAWHARAVALRIVHRFDEALASVDRALEQHTDHPLRLSLRGWLLCEMGRIGDGLAQIARAAEQALGSPATDHSSDSAHKRRHDAEQRDYLAGRGVHLKSGDVHFADGERLGTPAINAINEEPVSAQWDQSRPRIAVVDNFLTEEALEKLRRFCWGSTVWRTSYKDGYLGAMPEQGFACPLLAQIAEELRDTFPDIIGDHRLRMLWGFKYDSRLKGIGVHADQAAVNVNFWITPEEANCDPDSGGLVIWDVVAPKDWNIATYNADQGAVREFLARSGAKPVKVPYRANRAVIFDSDLFHETDTIDFKDGYLNWRINVTMLYGRRTHYGA